MRSSCETLLATTPIDYKVYNSVEERLGEQ